jgi:hypothetical protein
MNIRLWIGRAALLVGALLACLLPAAHAADFLDPEDAFKFSAAISDDGSAVEARFNIAEGVAIPTATGASPWIVILGTTACSVV